jgi:demethylmenaquinone methyltransferase/2-methoxy-6-polyprenyl-1,4-benzoquinol methylase
MQAKPLLRMFTSVPRRYDLVNHVITLGLDTGWRRKAARECMARQPCKVLDLCCGTGDLAINITQLAGDEVALIGIDYSQPMLEIATRKAASKSRDIPFIHGDVASLPFPDGHFDCIGMSFAFRNLTYKNPLTERYLAEIWRVLADSGRFVIVETSQPKSRLIRKVFHLYLRLFVSNAGSWISGNKSAYHYLAESATRFFTPEEVEGLLLSAGFSHFSYRPLLLGAAGIYVATK